ncbi:MAG TPA: CHASE3 domain-containing protein [Verrucomicrobiota bacterium]|nr:CHASE3 domain-containing protein [Verrucomicrobiota bacterium]
MKVSLGSKITAGFAVAVLVLACVGVLSYLTTTDLIQAMNSVARTRETLEQLESVLAMTAETETAQRGYLLTGSAEFLEEYQAISKNVGNQMTKLRALVAENANQQESLNRLELLISERFAALDDRIETRQQHGLQAAASAVALLKGKVIMDQIRVVVSEMRQEEERQLLQRQETSRDRSRHSIGIILTSSVLACVLGIVAVLLVRRDLWLREQAEKRLQDSQALLQSILDNTPAVVFLKGRDGRYLFVNRQFEQLAGIPRDQIVGRTAFDLLKEELAQAASDHDLKVLQTGEAMQFDETVMYPDGPHTHLAVKFPLRDADGKIYATGAVSTDISDRKRAAQLIEKLNEDLERRAASLEVANKELEAFSYSVSHDLRAPLRHIAGFVELLTNKAGEKLDEASHRYLKIISDAAKQMGTLIDDLLVFSRMGRTELRQTKVDLNALVREAIEGLQHDLSGRNVNWKIAQLPTIQADPSLLRQVVVNLVGNAVKYTRPRNPAQIEIGCDDRHAREFVLFVRDNGVGFDMQYSHKLFGVFQRLHRSDEFEGTGIGLANVRRIILRHGGRTWAEGKVDGGATFYYTLPKQDAAN